MEAVRTPDPTEAAIAVQTAQTRQGCGRSAEAMALAGVPGFESYLPKDADPVAVQGPKGTPQNARMSFQDNDLSFGDVLDVLNPLQHIPVVGTLYRELTSDIPKPASQVAGDILFSGGVATLGSLVFGAALGATVVSGNAMAAQSEGKSMDKQVAEAVLSEGGSSSTKLAQNTSVTAEALPAQTVAVHGIGKAKNGTASVAQTRQAAAGVALANAMAQGKQPYGGVMDPNTAQQPSAPTTPVSKSKMLAPVSGTETNAIRTQARFAPRSTSVAGASLETEKLASPVQGAVSSVTAAQTSASSSADPAQLGKVMHDSAQQATIASQTGAKNALPPELVQDMMIMALDKYKSASALGADKSAQPLN